MSRTVHVGVNCGLVTHQIVDLLDLRVVSAVSASHTRLCVCKFSQQHLLCLGMNVIQFSAHTHRLLFVLGTCVRDQAIL